MKKFCVYKHTSPSGKVYIGITSQRPESRWRSDGSGYKEQKYFWNAIKKYGWENFTHDILFHDLSKEDACSKEIELISLYRSNDAEFGYNVSSGGDTGARGCHLSETHKDAIRKASTGTVFSTERRERISKALKGKSLSKEHRQHLSESHKGLRGNNRGKKFSKETREKIRASKTGANNQRAKKVRCVETGEVFDTAVEAFNKTGVNKSHISQVCKNNRKTAGGFRWEYA